MPIIAPKHVRKMIITGAITAAVLSGVAAYVWYENMRPPILEIYVIPLKSGQSVFIRTPSDKRILIDGGTNSEIIRHISSILPFYTRRIDKIVVTKKDGKHVTGLVDVVGRYLIGEIIVPTIDLESIGLASTTDGIYQAFIDVANKESIQIKKVLVGDSETIDEGIASGMNGQSNSPVRFDVLFPAATSSFKYSKSSAPELVMRISYGYTSVMLAGSITTKIQKFVAKWPITSSSTSALSPENLNAKSFNDLKSNVLVMSQNATANTVAPAFMKVVLPEDIIYSKALSKSQPSQEDHRFNIREVGAIKIVSDGVTIEIEKL